MKNTERKSTASGCPFKNDSRQDSYPKFNLLSTINLILLFFAEAVRIVLSFCLLQSGTPFQLNWPREIGKQRKANAEGKSSCRRREAMMGSAF